MFFGILIFEDESTGPLGLDLGYYLFYVFLGLRDAVVIVLVDVSCASLFVLVHALCYHILDQTNVFPKPRIVLQQLIKRQQFVSEPRERMQSINRAEDELFRGDLCLQLPLIHLKKVETNSSRRINNIH